MTDRDKPENEDGSPRLPVRENIDEILSRWPYEAQAVSVRIAEGNDGRDVIQMRVDMGILQLETLGKPDGDKPHGAETYFDYLVSRAFTGNGQFVMDDDDCVEADREFVQFYHRRICWLALREFRRAMEDADHTLQLMDFCRDHSPDEEWTLSHEQYRPFVLFHRTQAAALACLEDGGAKKAIAEIEQGLDRLRAVFAAHGAEEHYEDDELVGRLRELRDSLREQYDAGYRLQKKLEDAVAAEQYELAAEIRDELATLKKGRR